MGQPKPKAPQNVTKSNHFNRMNIKRSRDFSVEEKLLRLKPVNHQTEPEHHQCVHVHVILNHCI